MEHFPLLAQVFQQDYLLLTTSYYYNNKAFTPYFGSALLRGLLTKTISFVKKSIQAHLSVTLDLVAPLINIISLLLTDASIYNAHVPTT